MRGEMVRAYDIRHEKNEPTAKTVKPWKKDLLSIYASNPK
tara:strand:- start:1080 stop:1199 length:120 start_codon:yes stop_codon:yes gene_type:complete